MFGTYSQKVAILSITVIGVISLGGCNKTVYITYQPLKLGPNLYVSPQNNWVNAGSGRMWMVYCISKIKNEGSNAVDFSFHASDFYIEQGQSLVTAQANPSWAWTVQNKTVKGGTTEYNLGTIVFSVDVASPYPAWVPLYYETTSGEKVAMVQYAPAAPDPVLNNSLSQVSLPSTCFDGATIPD